MYYAKSSSVARGIALFLEKTVGQRSQESINIS